MPTSIRSGPNAIDEEVVEAASRRQRSAVEQLLGTVYPQVCRIAFSLCGQEKSGRAVVDTIMARSLGILPNWQTPAEVHNWFLHHTVLATREQGNSNWEPTRDCLITRVDRPAPEYLAFVRAFRHLPAQQREAIILFRGEQLEGRQVAVAMDCSTTAATNHLIAANKTLGDIALNTFDAQLTALARVYASLTPTEELIVGDVSAVARRLARRSLLRMARNVLAFVVVAAIAWMGWHLWGMLVF